MLYASLEDQKYIEEIVKGKPDRWIAMTGLTLTHQHIKDCDERQKKMYSLLKCIGGGVILVIIERIASDIHWPFLADVAKHVFGF